MSELRELYQEVILDHSKNPRNRGEAGPGSVHAEGHNPLCGDRLTLSVRLDGDKVVEAKFVGSGCAISTASASLMTEAIRGMSRSDVELLFNRFHDLVTGKEEPGGGAAGPPLGKLAVFAGVREFPLRIKCASLAWHTLHNLILGEGQTASTE
jgi:nitrogen fixation NifU-like protein